MSQINEASGFIFMTSKKSTRDQVPSLCWEYLQQHQQFPNVGELRELMGNKGGSNVIQDELNAFRQEVINLALATRLAVPGIPKDLISLVQNLWNTALAEAESRFQEQRANFDAKLQVNEEAMKQAFMQRDLANQERDRLFVEIEKLNAIVSDLQNQLSAEQTRRQMAETHTNEMRQLASQAQVEAESARNRAEQLVKEAAQKADKAIELAQASAAQEIARERADAERREALAYDRLEGLRVQLYTETSRQRQEMEQKLQGALQEHQAYRNTAAELERVLRSKIAECHGDVSRFRGRIDELEALNQTLSQEKQDLLQRIERMVLIMRGQHAEAVVPDDLAHQAASLIAAAAGANEFDLLVQLNEEFFEQLQQTGVSAKQLLAAARLLPDAK